ncbi:MAG: hypothetical protein H0V82_02700 [Candidatus Protochlamydia sp.]|nr:hypothetical protein [Candidatus Protochlamydia sp.]
MITTLQNLHAQLSAVFIEETAYLGIQRENPPFQLIRTAEKTCHLYEIFEYVNNQIQSSIALPRQGPLLREIHGINVLKNDAQGFYTRYCQKSNSWKRWLLKGLEARAPHFLKRILPSIFDNGIERAERITAENFEGLKTTLENRIIYLQTLQNPPLPNPNPNPIPGRPLTPPVIPPVTPPPPVTPTDPAPIPVDQNTIDSNSQAALLAYKINRDEQIRLEILQKFNILIQLATPSPSLREWNEAIAQITTLANSFSDLFTCEKKEALFNTAGIPHELLARINVANLTPEDRLDIVTGTCLENNYKNIYKQESITFVGVAQMGGTNIARLKNSNNDQINEKALENFSGNFKTYSTLLADMEALFKTKNSCLPASLEIDFENNSFDLTALDLILKMKNLIPSITLVNLTKINLTELNATAEQEQAWLANLSKINCPHLRTFVLADHAKTYLSPQDFSNLLKICPTFELLQQCLRFCSSPKEVLIPHQLTDQKYLNLCHYPAELSSHLLNLWSPLKFVKMHPQTTQEVLKDLILQGILASATHLDLSLCNLSTDALFTLASLSALSVLKLPELTKGLHALTHLPKFDNPFKINLFYTQAAITRPIAHQMYTGLPNWANLFEIQLARKGQAASIASNQFILDPHSVTNWLYQNDYLQLSPQNTIRSIIADNCEYITDDNIVQFVQKFPNTSTISLFNSPFLTNKGVADLLAACPKIKTLDLTGCILINDNLLDESLHRTMQERLQLKLMLSGTSISQDQVNIFKSAIVNNERLEFEITNFKITNEQLVNDESLENILNAQPLNRLLKIDLEGCVNLTDHALSKLLDRLNHDQILIQDGAEISNPCRLNIFSLNLTGCSSVTIKAFDGEMADGKIQPKILNSLTQIITGKTKLNQAPILEADFDDQLKIDYSDDSDYEEEEDNEPVSILENGSLENQTAALKNIYPCIDFYEQPSASTYRIDLDKQLRECLDYLDSKSLNDEGITSHQLAEKYISNRIAIELFSAQVEHTASHFQLMQIPVNVQEPEFYSINVAFGPTENGNKTSFKLPKELLYSHSASLRKALRPGGELAQTSFINLINQNATPEAAEAIYNLMQGKEDVSSLEWKTASLAAELAKPMCLDLLEIHQKNLIERFHSQFDIERADEMLFQARTLEDWKGLKQFEDHLTLLAEFDFENLKETLHALAETHQLKHLTAKLVELAMNAIITEMDEDQMIMDRNYARFIAQGLRV